MYSWGKWLSYLAAAVLGFFIGGFVGAWLGETMKKHRVLDQADKDHWPTLLTILFSLGGIGAGILIASRIFGD